MLSKIWSNFETNLYNEKYREINSNESSSQFCYLPLHTGKIWNILDHEWSIGREQLYARSSSNFSQLHY